MTNDNVSKAYEVLQDLNIPYKRIDHAPIFSVKEYDAELPGPQVKVLLLKPKKSTTFYMVLIAEEKHLDLKALASELDCKRLSFASSEDLDELLQLESGHLTPLALFNDTNHQIQVVIDQAVDQEDTVGVHPNINTTTLIIQFHDLIRYIHHYGYEPIYVHLP